MKTVKEWLEGLDEPHRSQALKNMYDQTRVDKPSCLDIECKTLANALSKAFYWAYTPEGCDYWVNFLKSYQNALEI